MVEPGLDTELHKEVCQLRQQVEEFAALVPQKRLAGRTLQKESKRNLVSETMDAEHGMTSRTVEKIKFLA